MSLMGLMHINEQSHVALRHVLCPKVLGTARFINGSPKYQLIADAALFETRPPSGVLSIDAKHEEIPTSRTKNSIPWRELSND